VQQKPFYGGFGMIAEHGIPKAAFRAFELLHNLGDQRLMPDAVDALVTKRSDGAIVAAVWNYAEPGQKAEPKIFRLKVANSPARKYRVQVLDASHGSSLGAWMAMDKPSNPTKAQIARLKEASKLAVPAEHPVSDPIRLEPRSLALVVIR
jgi:xylan 1,4-beta-xylosidase